MVNMQKSLNHIDSEERSLNVILSGLPENDIKVPNAEDMTLKTDYEKVIEMLRIIKCDYFTQRHGEISSFFIFRYIRVFFF